MSVLMLGLVVGIARVASVLPPLLLTVALALLSNVSGHSLVIVIAGREGESSVDVAGGVVGVTDQLPLSLAVASLMPLALELMAMVWLAVVKCGMEDRCGGAILNEGHERGRYGVQALRADDVWE